MSVPARPRDPLQRRSTSGAAEERASDVRLLAAAAVRRGGKVLVIREEDEPFRKTWVLPEGYPRPGETLSAAAVREVREEIGLDVEVAGLLGLYEDFAPDPGGSPVHWVLACFLAYPVDGSATRPSREAIDFAWVDPATTSLTSPPMIQRVLSDLALRPSDEGAAAPSERIGRRGAFGAIR